MSYRTCQKETIFAEKMAAHGQHSNIMCNLTAKPKHCH